MNAINSSSRFLSDSYSGDNNLIESGYGVTKRLLAKYKSKVGLVSLNRKDRFINLKNVD